MLHRPVLPLSQRCCTESIRQHHLSTALCAWEVYLQTHDEADQLCMVGVKSTRPQSLQALRCLAIS